jgi:hypothetical protein
MIGIFCTAVCDKTHIRQEILKRCEFFECRLVSNREFFAAQPDPSLVGKSLEQAADDTSDLAVVFCELGSPYLRKSFDSLVEWLVVLSECQRSFTHEMTSDYSGRICGNRITSRMLAQSVSIMIRRSMPIPSPAVGGKPYSSART